MNTAIRCLGLVAALVLVGCTERPQTASTRKLDEKPWQGAAPAYTLPGWKTGDRASWDEEMRQRAQAQNEYLRAPARP